MKKINFQMTAKRFYLIGKYAFFTTGLIGLIRLVDIGGQLASYEIFSSIASVIFQFALSGFMAHLGKQEDYKEVSDGDIFKMQEALDNLNLTSDKNNGKKTRH